jgi:hypothetical protein
MIEETLGGRAMVYLGDKGIRIPESAWQTASSMFARNAKGDAQVFLGSTVRPESIFLRIEKPILDSLGNATIVVR